MTSVSAYLPLNSSISSTLSAGTALISSLGGTAIYYGMAPKGTDLPYVVWSYQYSAPDNMTPSESTTQLVYVRAYAETAAQAGTIDARICDLLHKQTLSVTGWTNFWSARETEFAYPETDEAGVTTWTAGAYYRIRLDQ
jgi:hypothetical protein